MISCDDSTLFINIDFYVKWRRYNDDKNCNALSPQSHTHAHFDTQCQQTTLIHVCNYMLVHTHTLAMLRLV